MPCLRARFNYAAVYLGDCGGVVGRSLVEGKVRIKTHSGKRQYLWFDGFMERRNLQESFTALKILDVEAYLCDFESGKWVELGKGAQCLGALMANNKVKCVLENDFPIVWCEIPQ